VHKGLVPKGKTVNAEFCKGVMDRLLRRIHRICPAAFCWWDFFLLRDNASAHKAAYFCQFMTQKMLQPFVTPIFSRFFPARLFPVPQVEMKLQGLNIADVAEIQEAVTDELKRSKTRGNFGSFSEHVLPRKAYIYICELGLLRIKKVCILLMCPSI